MKYLKSISDYKLDIDEVILECKNILMELVDDRIDVGIYESGSNTISVNIHSPKANDIIYSKIKSNVEHLLSYMSEDFNYELYSSGVYLGGLLKRFSTLKEVEDVDCIDHLCFLFHLK